MLGHNWKVDGPSKLDHWHEPAEDHALAIEWHRVLLRIEPVVRLHQFAHPAHGGVAGGLVGPFDPGENDCLVLRRLDGSAEVGELAVWHVVAPAFENSRGAELLEDGIGLA